MSSCHVPAYHPRVSSSCSTPSPPIFVSQTSSEAEVKKASTVAHFMWLGGVIQYFKELRIDYPSYSCFVSAGLWEILFNSLVRPHSSLESFHLFL